MKNDGRGMSPKEQRKLADDLVRTVQWLRTIGIKPESTQDEIIDALNKYTDSLIDRKIAIEIDKDRAVGVVIDLSNKRADFYGMDVGEEEYPQGATERGLGYE